MLIAPCPAWRWVDLLTVVWDVVVVHHTAEVGMVDLHRVVEVDITVPEEELVEDTEAEVVIDTVLPVVADVTGIKEEVVVTEEAAIDMVAVETESVIVHGVLRDATVVVVVAETEVGVAISHCSFYIWAAYASSSSSASNIKSMAFVTLDQTRSASSSVTTLI